MADTSLTYFMGRTLGSLMDWGNDALLYHGQRYRCIINPAVRIDDQELVGSLPGLVYPLVILKDDFPAGPPPVGARLTVGGKLFTRRGDAGEDNLSYTITLAKHGA